MARENTLKNYLKVTGISRDERNIYITIYRDKVQRADGLDEWSSVKDESVYSTHLSEELDKNAYASESIRSNITSAAYKALVQEVGYRDEDGWKNA